MTRLRVSLAAKVDLREIRRYSKAAFRVRVTLDYMNGLRGAFTLLRERPFAGADESDLGDDIRKFSYRSHGIYYRTGGDMLEIVRILHHAQDARANLDDR